MNTIFKKQLPRRTFLRGMGATIALPMLEAMARHAQGSRRAKALRVSQASVDPHATMTEPSTACANRW